MEGNDEDNVTKNSENTLDINFSSTKEVAELPESYPTDKGVKEPHAEDEGRMEDSPVMGLLNERKSKNSGMLTKDIQENDIPSDDKIKEAMRRKLAYFKTNSE